MHDPKLGCFHGLFHDFFVRNVEFLLGSFCWRWLDDPLLELFLDNFVIILVTPVTFESFHEVV